MMSSDRCIDDDTVPANCGYVTVSNRVGIATIVFVALAIVSSVAVLAVIFGYNKDRRDLRHRILLNLFLSNLVFSAGSAVPYWMTEPGRKTRLLSADAECNFNGLFFAGKYWMVCVEVFIVAASIASLRTHSVNIPARAEAAAHVLCPVVGAAIGIYSNAACRAINADLAAAALQGAGTEAVAQRYNELFARLVDGWLGLFALVLALWLGQRVVLHRILVQWDAEREKAEREVEEVFNFAQRALLLNNKRALLHTAKDGFDEIARPLEPYIVVFVGFSVPVIVTATTSCEEQTSRHLTVGCQHVCQMLLTLRPLATAAVFFADRQCRQQLLGGAELARRVGLRLRNVAAWAVGRRETTGGGDRVRFNAELEQVQEFSPESTIDGPPGAAQGRRHRRRNSSSSSDDDTAGGEVGDGRNHGAAVGAGMPYNRMD